MQYYMIEWNHEEADEPWRLYLEMDRQGNLKRKIEAYRIGIYEVFDSPDTPPIDLRQLAGNSGYLSDITRIQFEDIWEQAQQAPDNFMGMFF